MTSAIEMLLPTLLAQGIVTQEEFDKKVKEYSKPVIKQKNLIESIKSPVLKYQDVLEDESATIEDVRLAKIESLKQLCSESVYEGFSSETLGYSFGFNEHDQANITQQILLFVMGSTADVQWKSLDAGVITLTKDEFMQLVEDAKNHKIEKQTKFWELEALVLEAESIEAIKEINWQE